MILSEYRGEPKQQVINLWERMARGDNLALEVL